MYTNFISKVEKQANIVPIISEKTQFSESLNLGINNQQKKNFSQPIQLLYFKRNQLKSYHANCFAKGKLTSIDWNTEDKFANFLHKSAVITDSLKVGLANYSKIYHEINSNTNKNMLLSCFGHAC